jgi:hypothetical protein
LWVILSFKFTAAVNRGHITNEVFEIFTVFLIKNINLFGFDAEWIVIRYVLNTWKLRKQDSLKRPKINKEHGNVSQMTLTFKPAVA